MTLHEYLRVRGLTQTKFSRLAGLSIYQVNRLLRHGICSKRTAIAVERATNGHVSASLLLTQAIKNEQKCGQK